jgi:hypothetical protein
MELSQLIAIRRGYVLLLIVATVTGWVLFGLSVIR